MQVRTEAGDTVDGLCWRHLGSSSAVEQVLLDNPGIAAHGPVLPAGLLITLPDAAPTASTTRNLINLWD